MSVYPETLGVFRCSPTGCALQFSFPAVGASAPRIALPAAVVGAAGGDNDAKATLTATGITWAPVSHRILVGDSHGGVSVFSLEGSFRAKFPIALPGPFSADPAAAAIVRTGHHGGSVGCSDTGSCSSRSGNVSPRASISDALLSPLAERSISGAGVSTGTGVGAAPHARTRHDRHLRGVSRPRAPDAASVRRHQPPRHPVRGRRRLRARALQHPHPRRRRVRHRPRFRRDVRCRQEGSRKARPAGAGCRRSLWATPSQACTCRVAPSRRRRTSRPWMPRPGRPTTFRVRTSKRPEVVEERAPSAVV